MNAFAEFLSRFTVLAGRLGISKTKNDDLVEIYRAVSPTEYNDIMKTQSFRTVPGSMEAKQFGFSLHETIDFANEPINCKCAAVVGVTISRSALDKVGDFTHVDRSTFRSGTVTVHGSVLADFNREIKGIRHAY